MIKKLSLLGLVCLASLSVHAAGLKAWSGSGTVLSNNVDTVTYYVASANSVNQGPACAGVLNLHSDLSTAVLQFYNTTNSYALTGTNATVSGSSTTNIPTSSGITNASGVTSNGVCVIRHTATDTYERNRFYAGTTTNIIFMYPLLVTTTDGDIVYACARSGSILVGTNNPIANATTIGPIGTGAGIASGNLLNNANTPFLMELNGTSISDKVQINIANGFYLP